MNVRIIVMAESAYAAISTPYKSMDIRLYPGRSPAQSLRESADEMRGKADVLLARAALIDAAAAELEAA